MNLILLNKNDLKHSAQQARLTGRRHEHILKILKSKEGDQLSIGLINDKIGIGTIININKNYTDLDIALTDQAPKPLNITLVLALPRPIVLNRILSSICSIGMKEIFLIHTQRVEKSYWASPVLKQANMDNQFMLGLEQAGDTFMPVIHMKKHFNRFMENELAQIAEQKTAIVAHPNGNQSFSINTKKPAILAIGPEGGFVPSEIEKFTSIGFKAVNFAQRILRVETAIPFIVSKLV